MDHVWNCFFLILHLLQTLQDDHKFQVLGFLIYIYIYCISYIHQEPRHAADLHTQTTTFESRLRCPRLEVVPPVPRAPGEVAVESGAHRLGPDDERFPEWNMRIPHILVPLWFHLILLGLWMFMGIFLLWNHPQICEGWCNPRTNHQPAEVPSSHCSILNRPRRRHSVVNEDSYGKWTIYRGCTSHNGDFLDYVSLPEGTLW